MRPSAKLLLLGILVLLFSVGQGAWALDKETLDLLLKKGVITQAEGEKLATAHEAVMKVIEVDDFAPEALSPIYKKTADVHQFFQELGEQRAAS